MKTIYTIDDRMDRLLMESRSRSVYLEDTVTTQGAKVCDLFIRFVASQDRRLPGITPGQITWATGDNETDQSKLSQGLPNDLSSND